MIKGELSRELTRVSERAHICWEEVKILQTKEDRDLRYRMPDPPKGWPKKISEESMPLTPTESLQRYLKLPDDHGTPSALG